MKRANASKLGYNNRWRIARHHYLNQHPLCVMCAKEGKITAATVVDHIEPHKGDMALFWESANWQSLCTSHHSSTKQRDEKANRTIGCDEDGLPLDPNHHWHQR